MKLVSFVFLAILFSASTIFAASDTIKFAGNLGSLIYSPSSLNVHVGDTVVFDPNVTGTSFWSHPLESTALPPGADSVARDSGMTPFIYVVKFAGTYNYQCYYHHSSGMKGTFTASVAGVKENNPNAISAQNFPNPFRTTTTIQYELQNPGMLNLKIFDIAGKEIRSVSGYQNSGLHQWNFDAANLSAGDYYYRIEIQGDVLYHRMLIVR